MDHIQFAYYRVFIVARLDPDGNEISTDEEEMIERARAITRRNNPQPFFSLFQPVARGSDDRPTASRDDTGAFEAQTPPQPHRMNATQFSGTTEGTSEVARFLGVPGGMNAHGIMSVYDPGFP